MLFLARIGWFRLIGPLFNCDLIRTSRRPSYLILRAGYPLVVLLLLLIVFAIWYLPDNNTQKSSADFCMAFFAIFMLFNQLAVFLLTPAYTAGALAQEKEHQTLDALLASDLRDREIVLGTYLSRITKLGLIFLSPLPIFSALQFVGGVEPVLILAGFLFTAISLCSLAALSIFFSVRAKKPRDALMRTYMFTIGVIVVTTLMWSLLQAIPWAKGFPGTATWPSPVTLEDVVDWIGVGNPIIVWVEMIRGVSLGSTFDKLLPQFLTGYALWHAAVIAGSCLYAIYHLRRFALDDGEQSIIREGQDHSLKGWLRLHWSALPFLADRPMAWKELLVDRTERRGPIRRFLVGIGIAMLFLPIIHLTYYFRGHIFFGDYARRTELLSIWLRFCCGIFGGIALLQSLASAAGSIVSERDKQTLPELLATPLTNRAIFRAKWQAALLSSASVWKALLGLWCIGLWTGCLHPLGILSFLLCWGCFAAFLVSMGMWFSVVCRTARQATAAAFLSLSVVSGGTFLAAYNLAEDRIPVLEAIGLIPNVTLMYVSFSPAEWDYWLRGNVHFRPGVYLLSLGFWIAASIGLYLAARSRFGVLTGRIDADEEASLGPRNEERWPTGQPTRARAWPVLLRQQLRFRLKLVGLFGFTLLPLLALLGFYEVKAIEGEEELTNFLANLDKVDPDWRNYAPPSKSVSANAKLSEMRTLINRAGAAIPKDWSDGELEAIVRKDFPDQETMPAADIAEIQQRRKNSRESAALIRRLWTEGDHVAKATPPEQLARKGPTNWALLENLAFLDRILAAEILGQLHEGHVEEAAILCGSFLLYAGAQSNESEHSHYGLFNGFRRQSSYETALRLVARTLGQGEVSAALLLELQKVLEIADQDDLESRLRRERARLVATFEQRSGEIKSLSYPYLHEIGYYENPKYNGVPALPAIQEIFFHTSLATFDVQRGEILKLLTDCITGESSALSAPPPLPFGLAFNRTQVEWYLFGLQHQALYTASVHCELRATIVAIALERYRLEHGSWPSSLMDLTPKYLKSIPLGKFDGKPFQFKREKNAIVVYTVGADRIDRGGNLGRSLMFNGRIDIGVRLWDKPSRRQPAKPITAR